MLLTKQRLAQALKKKMETVPLSQITVRDITDECGINRQTFYYHFQSLYDLLEWIFKSQALDEIQPPICFENWQDHFLNVLRYVERNRAFCLNVYHSVGREYLEEFVTKNIQASLDSIFHDLSHGKNLMERDRQMILNFYSCALTGLLLNWLKNGTNEPPEAFVARLARLIDGDLERSVEKMRGPIAV